LELNFDLVGIKNPIVLRYLNRRVVTLPLSPPPRKNKNTYISLKTLRSADYQEE
jgi:hypothetical protein